MKFYKVTGQREYGEQPAADCRTGEAVTITERRAIMDISDYITIYKCVIVNDNEILTGFQFLVMPDGYTLSIYVCDYATGARIIKNNISALMYGKMKAAQLCAMMDEMQYNYAHKIRRRTEGKR